MDAEGALEQMVDTFTDVDVQPRVAVLEFDLRGQVKTLFHGPLEPHPPKEIGSLNLWCRKLL